MDARKINIQKETPSLQDFIKKYADDQVIANVVPNALDIMRMGTVCIPIVYIANTCRYVIVKESHINLIYTLALWIHNEIELKDSFIEDPEDLKSTHYRRRVTEKYLNVDVIVQTDDNHKEVQLLFNLYKQI